MLLYNSFNTASIGCRSLLESVSVIVVAAEALPIPSQEGNICVQFWCVQIWSGGVLGGMVTSLFPCVDLIFNYCVAVALSEDF